MSLNPNTEKNLKVKKFLEKKLISEGKAEELTLEAIGIQSGFTNRNTFFTAFKKVEGVSPSAFLAQTLRQS